MEEFNYEVGHRGASIRVPVSTKEKDSGFYEDRRPSSNFDPYLVSAMLVDTTCLNGKYHDEIMKAYQSYLKERTVLHNDIY